jgi:hypothetical protein
LVSALGVKLREASGKASRSFEQSFLASSIHAFREKKEKPNSDKESHFPAISEAALPGALCPPLGGLRAARRWLTISLLHFRPQRCRLWR